MKSSYDVIIIGAGHNGLVTATYLAKAGLSVLILERREILGGLAATEELFSAYHFNIGAAGASMFSPKIIKDLSLEKSGLRFIESQVAVFAPHPEGAAITLWRDNQRTIAALATLSPADAERYQAYLDEQQALVKALGTALSRTPPDLGQLSAGEILPWLKVGWKLRRSGQPDMMEFLRVLPLPVKDYLDGWFASSALKGVLAVPSVFGGMVGPYAAGTTLMMLYHQLGGHNGGYRTARFVQGGVGQLSQVLAALARGYGAEIEVGARVESIIMDDERAHGVILANGDAVAAQMVVSNADPRNTFFNLVGGVHLEATFMREIANIRYHGATASVNLALSDLPAFTGATGPEQLTGYIAIAPSMDYIERAHDAAKYGRISPELVLEANIPSLLEPKLAPEGHHVMSISVQYAPYKLAESNWDDQREKLGDQVVETLARYAPDLPDLVVQRHISTPLDWERDFSLTEGQIYHGQMGLDQLLFMRPVPGYANYRTPFEGLYLCGAGTHPGGGISGLPGYNAAQAVLKDWK
jgi:phytoene dehydrogenase-like protein